MGDYYEGKIHFKLKKCTPKNIIDMLKFLNIDKYRSTNRPTFKEVIDKFGIICDDAEKYDEIPKVSKYRNNVCLSICTKHFERNSILWMIDICRPYMVNSTPEDNYLGTITDEDGYYYKEFYADKDIFRKQMDERSAICNPSCDKFYKNTLCYNYIFCLRAYNIGKAENEKL